MFQTGVPREMIRGIRAVGGKKWLLK
jgi:hypothetical protein